MPAYIALLRAVNVGGIKVLMSDLKSLCEQAGCTQVKTYIASGNVVFLSRKSETQIKKSLEAALTSYLGRPASILIRTAAEMAAVAADNPFLNEPPNKIAVIFLDLPPAADALSSISNQAQEELRLGLREIYVYYPEGMGQSRLRIPAAKTGTARNLNTVRVLAEMAGQL